MTRIIAGSAGGRSLRTPPGSGTRPTSDRVREALFSALDARDVLVGASVLDLYAGSGALGLEAASRGAVRVDLVESDRRAAAVVRANLAIVGAGRFGGVDGSGASDAARGSEPRLAVHAVAVATLLARPALTAYDLVLIDPPYDLAETALASDLTALATGGWLAPDALVVVERSSRSPEPTWPDGLTPEKPRRYGETVLWFAGRPPTAADC